MAKERRGGFNRAHGLWLVVGLDATTGFEENWNIEGEEDRRIVLSYVAAQFKAFRSYLTTRYVYKIGEMEKKDPCSVYTHIRKEEWAEFVKQCNKKRFKERSEIARKAQKRNLHPHTWEELGVLVTYKSGTKNLRK